MFKGQRVSRDGERRMTDELGDTMPQAAPLTHSAKYGVQCAIIKSLGNKADFGVLFPIELTTITNPSWILNGYNWKDTN